MPESHAARGNANGRGPSLAMEGMSEANRIGHPLLYYRKL